MPDGSPGTTDDDRIEAAVRAVLGSMAGDITAREAALLAELEALGRTIARAKAEIAALSVDDITGAHIPSATDELDAIVGHTAEATNEILDSCEVLEKLQAELAEPASTVLQGAVTRIYEACSFQDITGQRISKVVAALKAIESRVEAAVANAAGRAVVPAAPPVAPRTEGQELAHGPQLPGGGTSQEEIDRLLASFD